jgi:hypothetical protein
MSDISPLNTNGQELMLKTTKNNPLKPFILPVLSSLLFIIWKYLLSANGVLKSPLWMEKWG